MTASRASTPASRRMWSNPSGSGFLVREAVPPAHLEEVPVEGETRKDLPRHRHSLVRQHGHPVDPRPFPQRTDHPRICAGRVQQMSPVIFQEPVEDLREQVGLLRGKGAPDQRGRPVSDVRIDQRVRQGREIERLDRHVHGVREIHLRIHQRAVQIEDQQSRAVLHPAIVMNIVLRCSRGASTPLRSRPSTAHCDSARRNRCLAPYAAAWNPPLRPTHRRCDNSVRKACATGGSGGAAAGGGRSEVIAQPCAFSARRATNGAPALRGGAAGPPALA